METNVCHDGGKVLKRCCSSLLPVPLWTVLGIGEGRVARERGKGLCLNCSPVGGSLGLGVGAA